MRIKSERKHHHVTYYQLFYDRGDGSGYSFNCDEHGIIKVPVNPAAFKNYVHCQNNPAFKKEIIECHANWTEPRVGECECGSDVELEHFTNTCDNCNRDYNMSGHELASREQWGEETGECLSDILSVDRMSPEDYANSLDLDCGD